MSSCKGLSTGHSNKEIINTLIHDDYTCLFYQLSDGYTQVKAVHMYVINYTGFNILLEHFI